MYILHKKSKLKSTWTSPYHSSFFFIWRRSARMDISVEVKDLYFGSDSGVMITPSSIFCWYSLSERFLLYTSSKEKKETSHQSWLAILGMILVQICSKWAWNLTTWSFLKQFMRLILPRIIYYGYGDAEGHVLNAQK